MGERMNNTNFLEFAVAGAIHWTATKRPQKNQKQKTKTKQKDKDRWELGTLVRAISTAYIKEYMPANSPRRAQNFLFWDIHER